jgi:hypothetical protein
MMVTAYRLLFTTTPPANEDTPTSSTLLLPHAFYFDIALA